MTTSNLLIVCAYNLVIWVGTAFIVFHMGHSGWWFLMSIIASMSISTERKGSN